MGWATSLGRYTQLVARPASGRGQDKKLGWGRELDDKLDSLLKRAGELLGDAGSITDEVYRIAIAYGRLSMALLCIAYHTVDAHHHGLWG